MKWRLMLVPPRSGAENMARDTGLMDRARETGESVFSVYSWERPTLSLGRNQTATGKYDLSAIESRGMDVVRRPTGGRALLHDREVTYSVAAPISTDETLSESYERINSLLLEALFSLGVEARVAAATTPALAPGEIPCFAEPSKGELVSDGRKLVGSAQVRESGALLQHGSILIEDDQALIARVSLIPPATDAAPAATLSVAMGRVPEIGEVAEALFAAVIWSEDAGARRLSESEVSEYTARHLEKYRSEWWTWRR
jgi:lipoate-protein ligase A